VSPRSTPSSQRLAATLGTTTLMTLGWTCKAPPRNKGNLTGQTISRSKGLTPMPQSDYIRRAYSNANELVFSPTTFLQQ
jgi:hypothetical protein